MMGVSPVSVEKGIRVLWTKVLTTCYRRVVVMVRPLDRPIADRPPRLPVVISILGEDDLEAYRRFRPDQLERILEARRVRGDRCFAAWHEGRIVHAAWVATGGVHVPYLRRDLMLQSGDVYIYDSFTLPAFRGHGLAQARSAHLLKHYRQLGYRRALGVVAVENKVAFRPALGIGFYPIGLYGCVRFGPWQWDWQRVWREEPLPRLARAE